MSDNEQVAVNRLAPQFGRREARPVSNLRSRATSLKHAPATILLHWSTVVALVMSVAAIYLRDAVEDKTVRLVLMDVHRQLGLLVLICVPLRLLVRYLLGFVNQSAGMAALLRWVAATTHVVLYGFLIALPLIGWAATSAKGINLFLFGVVPIPSLVAPDPDIADALVDYHAWGSWALMAMVGAHAAAALWHHFIRRDRVLSAMLPAPIPERRRGERRSLVLPVAYDRRQSMGAQRVLI